MRILQVCPRIPAPPADGGAVYVYEIGRHLAFEGHDLTIVSLYSNRHQQDAELVNAYGVLHYMDGEFKDYGLFAAIKSILTRQPISIQHRMSRKVMGRLMGQVKTTPDVILLEGIHTGWFLDMVRNRWPGIPVVMRESNVEYLLLRRNAENTSNPAIAFFYRLQSAIMKSFESRILQKVDAMTTISPADRQKLKPLASGTPIKTIEAGGPIINDVSNTRDVTKMIAISNWLWKPNYDGLKWFLDQVWPEVYRRNPELVFFIIGDGLSNKFKSDYESENVVLKGFVKDLEPYLNSAGFQVAPLFSGSGMKLKVLNALSHGLPIITTSIGAEGINMTSGVHYMNADNRDQFENAIDYLVNNPESRESLAVNGRKLIREHYNWETQAKKLSKFLEEIVNKQKG